MVRSRQTCCAGIGLVIPSSPITTCRRVPPVWWWDQDFEGRHAKETLPSLDVSSACGQSCTSSRVWRGRRTLTGGGGAAWAAAVSGGRWCSRCSRPTRMLTAPGTSSSGSPRSSPPQCW